MASLRTFLSSLFLALATLMVPSLAFAADGAAGSAGYIAIGAGLAIGLAAFGAAGGQGRAAAAFLDAVGRNPGAYEKAFIPLIIALVLIESIAIYGFVIAFLLQGKI